MPAAVREYIHASSPATICVVHDFSVQHSCFEGGFIHGGASSGVWVYGSVTRSVAGSRSSSSSRTTGRCFGASVARRNYFPLTRTTVTSMSSPVGSPSNKGFARTAGHDEHGGLLP